MTNISIFYSLCLVLASISYLAFKPFYFSESLANFNASNVFGGPVYETESWRLMTGLIWAALSVPILVHIFRKHKSIFMPYLLAFCAALGMVVIKSWPGPHGGIFVADLLTALLYLSGLFLLLSLYIPQLKTSLMRHGVYLCLSVYVFVWFFHSIGLYWVFANLSLAQFGRASPIEPYEGDVTSIAYMVDITLLHLTKLTQLLPLAPVLLLSLFTTKGSGGVDTRRYTLLNMLLIRVQSRRKRNLDKPTLLVGLSLR